MYEQLAQIARLEYAEIITAAQTIGRRASAPLKLRLRVVDGTLIDIWLSPDYQRYSYHWEQRAKRGQVYRHDSAPDHPHVGTHPKHCHNGDEDTVEVSYIPDDPPEALRYFLDTVSARVIEFDEREG